MRAHRQWLPTTVGRIGIGKVHDRNPAEIRSEVREPAAGERSKQRYLGLLVNGSRPRIKQTILHDNPVDLAPVAGGRFGRSASLVGYDRGEVGKSLAIEGFNAIQQHRPTVRGGFRS